MQGVTLTLPSDVLALILQSRELHQGVMYTNTVGIPFSFFVKCVAGRPTRFLSSHLLNLGEKQKFTLFCLLWRL